MELKEELAQALEASRRRSLLLLEPLSEELQLRQHSRLMSPLVWDLAHVGNYEELWLLRQVAGVAPVDPTYDDIYNAFEHPRAARPSLPLLGPGPARSYVGGVRRRVLDVLDTVDLGNGSRLLSDGFVYRMVVQHEHQHDETMLATLQLIEGDGYRPSAPPPPPGRPVAVEEVLVPGGPFVMGTDHDPWAYDNERPAHEVDVPAFWIDTTPVTNRAFLEFMADGGYGDPRWWHPRGWEWRQEAGLEHPGYWFGDHQGGCFRNRFGWQEELALDEPVQHVCWYEADAYARWAGRRLPTEAEWEKAASWTPEGARRRYPWGDAPPDADLANLAQRHFRPAPIGAYPGGVSASGCHQMLGDVWEWTASSFEGYPGFSPFPYVEYSEVFFGQDHKVLRGGSWASDPAAVRNTFRNWDYPVRRQIFAGFRCARDA